MWAGIDRGMLHLHSNARIEIFTAQITSHNPADTAADNATVHYGAKAGEETKSADWETSSDGTQDGREALLVQPADRSDSPPLIFAEPGRLASKRAERITDDGFMAGIRRSERRSVGRRAASGMNY